MAPKHKRSKRASRDTASQKEQPAAGAAHAKDRTEKVRKEAEALLEKIGELLKEHKKEACPKSHTPHVHLCDGTKMDLRKMFK